MIIPKELEEPKKPTEKPNSKPINEPKQEKIYGKQIKVEDCLDKQGRLHRDATETIIKVLLTAWSLINGVAKLQQI
eukprot:5176300-Ditylum_brightwellii.AAC.1